MSRVEFLSVISSLLILPSFIPGDCPDSSEIEVVKENVEFEFLESNKKVPQQFSVKLLSCRKAKDSCKFNRASEIKPIVFRLLKSSMKLKDFILDICAKWESIQEHTAFGWVHPYTKKDYQTYDLAQKKARNREDILIHEDWNHKSVIYLVPFALIASNQRKQIGVEELTRHMEAMSAPCIKPKQSLIFFIILKEHYTVNQKSPAFDPYKLTHLAQTKLINDDQVVVNISEQSSIESDEEKSVAKKPKRRGRKPLGGHEGAKKSEKEAKNSKMDLDESIQSIECQKQDLNPMLIENNNMNSFMIEEEVPKKKEPEKKTSPKNEKGNFFSSNS